MSVRVCLQIEDGYNVYDDDDVDDDDDDDDCDDEDVDDGN